jgi:hypothetical protein
MTLFTKRKDWIVRFYDRYGDTIISHVIKDRTVHEANIEAGADMPDACVNWILVRIL